MSQYSETIGSFIRTSNYPLEADYIFNSEQELREYCNDNKAILHQGLFKIVANDEGQNLYWVIDKDGELEITKFLEGITLDKLKELSEELEDQQELIEALDLLIFDLEESVSQNAKGIAENSADIHAVVGCSPEEDIFTYLGTLDYSNLTVISETIKTFLNTVDKLDDKINTLPELQKFLSGYKDSNTLKEILNELVKDIKGNSNLENLGELEQAILTLSQITKNRADNLQSELDQTQQGVGLSGDGAFNADQETYYLKNATSVMNALKTLDRMINRIRYQFSETSSVTLTPTLDEESNTTTVTADVKISSNPGNQIKLKEDGIFSKVGIEYHNGILAIKSDGVTISEHNIGIDALLSEEPFYDKTTEKLVLLFKLHNGDTQRVEIPAGDLITEWDVQNEDEEGNYTNVELTKVRNIEGTDKLFANVKIVPNNSLKQNEYGQLYVENNIQEELENEANLRKTADDELMSLIVSLHSVITFVASNAVLYRGEPETVVYSSSVTFNNKPLNYTLTIDGENAPNGRLNKVYNADFDSKIVAGVFEINNTDPKVQTTFTKNIYMSSRYPRYSGFIDKEEITESDIFSLIKLNRSTVAGATIIDTINTDSYFWVCFPSNIILKSVTSNGFEVPLNDPIEIQTTNKGLYKCYRSTNKINAGKVTFNLS